MRTLAVAFVVAVASLSSATAQQPTVPATLDFTCHGYDEGATRAYNCIPAAGQESSMPTFVPPVGSTCNGGRIDEFPAGRLVFQIRCQEHASASGADFTVQNVRRYDSSINDADWIYFDVVANIRYSRFTLQVRLHYSDGTFRICNEYVPAMEPGQVEEGLVIPSICGPDVQWSSIQFVPPANLTCAGCGVYTARGLLYGRAISPLAPDSALEADLVIEDYRRRSTIGR